MIFEEPCKGRNGSILFNLVNKVNKEMGGEFVHLNMYNFRFFIKEEYDVNICGHQVKFQIFMSAPELHE